MRKLFFAFFLLVLSLSSSAQKIELNSVIEYIPIPGESKSSMNIEFFNNVKWRLLDNNAIYNLASEELGLLTVDLPPEKSFRGDFYYQNKKMFNVEIPTVDNMDGIIEIVRFFRGLEVIINGKSISIGTSENDLKSCSFLKAEKHVRGMRYYIDVINGFDGLSIEDAGKVGKLHIDFIVWDQTNSVEAILLHRNLSEQCSSHI